MNFHNWTPFLSGTYIPNNVYHQRFYSIRTLIIISLWEARSQALPSTSLRPTSNNIRPVALVWIAKAGVIDPDATLR